MSNPYDYIIIGSGIIGLSIARSLKSKEPGASILIIDKEPHEAFHASSRNSGVLHAGFYYTADSLKAKFTAEGSRAMKDYCRGRGLPVNECGKLVVAQNEAERQALHELFARGQKNGSTVSIISEEKAKAIDPNVKTFKEALHSPLTASIDPAAVCQSLKQDLEKQGVIFQFDCAYLKKTPEGILTIKGEITANKIINCAGLYADKIARDFGFAEKYTIIPFKGLYLKYAKNKTDVNVNIYPVPNLKNPFLGVHFTKTVDGTIKIGPTAIPALWRENYKGLSRFSLDELLNIASWEGRLFVQNTFGFRDLAGEEMKKYNRNYFIRQAKALVEDIDENGFGEWTPPGIRAQLLDKNSKRLIQDFIVEGNNQSIHILNAVSPAFTCAFSFAHYVTGRYLFGC